MAKSPALLLSFALLAVLPSAAYAEDNRYQILHFAETVSREVPNDWMNVRLVVESRHADAARAAAETTRKLNIVQARLRGLTDASVELENRSAYPAGSQGQRPVWADRAVIGISSGDFVAVAKLIGESAGEAQIGSVDFSLKADTRRRTVEALSLEALEGFRRRAGILSRAMGGGTGYRVVEVRLREDFDSASYAKAAPVMMRAAADLQPEPVFDSPGLTRVRQTAEGSIQY